MRIDPIPRNKSVAFWILVAVLVVFVAVIIGAVLWAVPFWIWTFVIGVGVGLFGYRRWGHGR
jgi:hypothetical protein